MKAINKNIFREIKNSFGRFMSLLLICAIGVGFFSGIKATGHDMKISADNFYDQQNLFDIRVLSTFGLTDDDAAAIAEIDGVSAVYTSKYTDLAAHYNDKEYLTRVYSWNNDEVNKVLIYDGRAPEAENECIVSANKLQHGFAIGDTISLTDLTDAEEFPLKYNEYTIVGSFDTPMFISMTQKGSTTIGDGALDSFMYITESNFTQEVYTEIYIKSDELTAMRSYSDEYEQLRDEIIESLEALGIDRSNIRYDEVLGEALEKISDGEKELAEAKADGERELADAKAEIEDAEQQIADGEKELADAKAEIEDAKQLIADGEKELADAKIEIDDGAVQLAEAEQQLLEAAQKIADGEKELADAKALLDESKAALDEGQAQINKNRAELEAAKLQLTEARAQLESGLAEYNAGYAQYEQGVQALALGEEQLKQAILIYGEDNPLIIQQKVELETNREILNQTKIQLDAAKAQLDKGTAEIAANEQVLETGAAQLDQAQKQLDEGRVQYEQGLAEYEAGYQEFLDGKREYEDGAATLEEKRAEYEDGVKQYEDGLAEIESAKAELEDGIKQYEDGVAELEDAKVKLADGKKEYEEGVATFNTEIADAEQEIADAKAEIADAGEAKWYVFTRDDNSGYSEYASNAERIDQIAMIFPVFFLLVAALVCLTTMSRMVEENRTHVGTLKALGYSNSRIMGHYMSYALVAAVVGSLIGAFGGMILFPNVIIYAYSIMYIITEVYCMFTMDNILISAGSMILAIALTVFFSCK